VQNPDLVARDSTRRRGSLVPARSHGMSKHLVYSVWRSMRSRCQYKTDKAWKDYGGRGIKVCRRWDRSFVAFWEDLGPTYKHGLTLERKNNDRNYQPSNCYWATRSQQQQNRRNNRMFKTPWGMLCMTEACRRAGFGITTLKCRIRYGWPTNKLFIQPHPRNRFAASLKRTGVHGWYK
jgi:hypothetical protein